MWSVGRKTGRLYLGSRVALLQVSGHALVSLPHAPTLPLAAVLQQLALKSQQQGIDLSKTVLDVDLSASLCKGAVVPSTFDRLPASGLPPLLQQALATQLSWPPVQWVLPSGSLAAGVLPVTTQGLMRNLRDWQAAQNIKLGVVQPLWALVTQSSRARSISIKGLILKEPDGLTAFSGNEPKASNSRRAAWRFWPAQEATDHSQSLLNAVAALSLDSSNMAFFAFHFQANFANEPGLKAWADHWEQT